MRLADKVGEGSRGGSSLPRDSNGEGASVLGEPGRTLEVASSVTATRLVWGGRRRMAPRQQRQATLSGQQGWGPAVAAAC